MQTLRNYQRIISAVVATLFLTLFLPQPAALAGMVGTADVLASEQRIDLGSKVVDFLKRQEVRDQLVERGVDPRAVEQRVAAMSDEEIQTLAGRIDDVPAGGDFLGAAVLVFVILLVTDIMGYTDIFPFVKKPSQRR